MGAEEQTTLLINNNNNNANIINTKYVKIKIEIDNDTDSFKTNLPLELFPFISSQDFSSIINQFNVYRKGHSYTRVFSVIGFVLFIFFLFFVIFIRSSFSSHSSFSTFFIIFIPIIIAIALLFFAFNIYRVKKNFDLEVELYIESINKLYPNLKFQGIFVKNRSFKCSFRGIEVIIFSTIPTSVIAPPSIYNSSHFSNFKYVSYNQLFNIQQQQLISSPLHYHTFFNNNDTISTNINHNHMNAIVHNNLF